MKLGGIFALAMGALAALAGAARADFILFDDAPTTGLNYFNSAQSSVQTYSGAYAIGMTRGAYAEAGMIGDSGVIPAGDNFLQFAFYLDAGNVAQFTLIITGNSQVVYDGTNNKTLWSVDGNSPGSTGAITSGSWHILTFDLRANPSYAAGVSSLLRIAPKPGGAGFTAYMDDVRVIPEPASIALLACGLGLLTRPRPRK